MNHKQLYYFTKVYECRSITEAARQLFITHQGLSKTILSLENEIGVMLFDRNNNQMVPTQNAVNLYPHAINVLDEFSLIENRGFTSESNQKQLRFLCSYDSLQKIPVEFFNYFSNKYKKILLHIEEMPDLIIMDMLSKNNVELALLPGPLDIYKYETYHLFDANFCVLINRENPLAELDTIPYSALNTEKIIFKGSRNPLDIVQLDAFERGGWKPDILLELSDTKYMYQLVYNNYAVAMTLDYLAENADPNKVVVRPFEPALSKSEYLVNNSNTILCNEASIFKRELVKWFDNN